MTTPRILHVVGSSKFGGGSLIILELARAAAQAGFDVAVLATDSDYVNRLHDQGIKTVEVDCVKRPINPVVDALDYRKLRSVIADGRYSIVHTHTSKGGVLGRAAAWRERVPAVVHTVHGFAVHEASRPAAIKAVSLIERWAAARSHRIVTVSEFHRQWAIDLGIAPPEKLLAIPNGIDRGRVGTSRSRNEMRGELGLSDSDFVLLSAGRLAEQKGLDDLIEATAILRSQLGIDAHLLLAGNGPLRPALEEDISARFLENHVSLLGFRDDLGDLLNAADVVAAPSLREGLSISVLEAMAARKPIVASNIASNLELSENGRVAVMVPTEDPATLATSIERLALNPEEASQMGERAQERFEGFYTVDRMTSQYLALYEELLSANSDR